ncbi:MAG TPA: hypothetical protein VIG85_00310 [Comamonas sp.]
MPTSSSRPFQRTWRMVRLAIVGLGVFLPYLAGDAAGYWHYGLTANLFLFALGAVLWLPLLALTWLYRFPHAMWPSCILGLGFALWSHVSVDRVSDVQNGLAVVWIPLMALVPAAVGALMGWGLDIRARRKAALVA